MPGTEDRSLAQDTIAVVLKGYPRLSETFIAQELRALERAGFILRFFSLRQPTDRKRHPIHDEMKASVVYLPEYLHDDPLRVLRCWWRMRTTAIQTRKSWLRDLGRDLSRNRIRRFGQALVLAAEMPGDVGWIYSHFIHTPASVARYAHALTGLSWSCSAHAKDIWTSPDWELSEKLDSARWTVTCTANGFRHLKDLSARDGNVHLVYHGIDLARFPRPVRRATARDGRDRGNPVRLLTVGRAVEKKGLDTLLDALALLPEDLSWTWTHIGGGELSDRLKAHVERLGLADRVALTGAQSQETVLDAYRASDLFILPSRIASNGDRDGLPNVLVEAASQELTCLSTPVSGIVELIRDGENGVLVAPDEPALLASAIERLARQPDLRAKLARAAADEVHARFDHLSTIGTLVELFRQNGICPLQDRKAMNRNGQQAA